MSADFIKPLCNRYCNNETTAPSVHTTYDSLATALSIDYTHPSASSLLTGRSQSSDDWMKTTCQTQCTNNVTRRQWSAATSLQWRCRLVSAQPTCTACATYNIVATVWLSDRHLYLLSLTPRRLHLWRRLVILTGLMTTRQFHYLSDVSDIDDVLNDISNFMLKYMALRPWKEV